MFINFKISHTAHFVGGIEIKNTITRREKMKLKKVLNRIVTALTNDGFQEENGDGVFMKDCDNVRVIVKKQGNRISVIAKASMTCNGVTTVLTNEQLFWKPQKDEYDMYDEYGSPEEILENLINDLYKKLFFLKAINDGEKLCVYEKPVYKTVCFEAPF